MRAIDAPVRTHERVLAARHVQLRLHGGLGQASANILITRSTGSSQHGPLEKCIVREENSSLPASIMAYCHLPLVMSTLNWQYIYIYIYKYKTVGYFGGVATFC